MVLLKTRRLLLLVFPLGKEFDALDWDFLHGNPDKLLSFPACWDTILKEVRALGWEEKESAVCHAAWPKISTYT